MSWKQQPNTLKYVRKGGLQTLYGHKLNSCLDQSKEPTSGTDLNKAENLPEKKLWLKDQIDPSVTTTD